jgi:hypothetical protein
MAAAAMTRRRSAPSASPTAPAKKTCLRVSMSVPLEPRFLRSDSFYRNCTENDGAPRNVMMAREKLTQS